MYMCVMCADVVCVCGGMCMCGVYAWAVCMCYVVNIHKILKSINTSAPHSYVYTCAGSVACQTFQPIRLKSCVIGS